MAEIYVLIFMHLDSLDECKLYKNLGKLYHDLNAWFRNNYLLVALDNNEISERDLDDYYDIIRKVGDKTITKRDVKILFDYVDEWIKNDKETDREPEYFVHLCTSTIQ